MKEIKKINKNEYVYYYDCGNVCITGNKVKYMDVAPYRDDYIDSDGQRTYKFNYKKIRAIQIYSELKSCDTMQDVYNLLDWWLSADIIAYVDNYVYN